MKGSSEDNDTLPEAVIYFYPRDEQIKKQVNLLFFPTIIVLPRIF